MPTDRNEERAMRLALTRAAKAKRYREFTPTSHEERQFAGRVTAPANTRRRQPE